MENNFLNKQNGLSTTDASSISNLCNQRSREIQSELESKNNYIASFKYDGEYYTETEPKPIDSERVEDLLLKKGRLHSLQAVIMEGIKAKESLMDSIRNEDVVYTVDAPEHPEYISPEILDNVSEDWGRSKLTSSEIQEYLIAESMASHIGQFIHKGGKLDTLRRELADFKPLDFISLETSKKVPVNRMLHHTPEQLLELHESLASKHREFEKKVNYYKAKIKNLSSEENIRINETNKKSVMEAEEKNQVIRNNYNDASKKYFADKRAYFEEFEADRSKRLNSASKLKIVVPVELQDLLDDLKSK